MIVVKLKEHGLLSICLNEGELKKISEGNTLSFSGKKFLGIEEQIIIFRKDSDKELMSDLAEEGHLSSGIILESFKGE